MSGGRDLYREKRILLPFPEFIVLYNGKGAYPDEKELKLSESFCDPGELRTRARIKCHTFYSNCLYNKEIR
jgi:hypothetical protein